MPLSVSVTCPDVETAGEIAQAALQARLVACANILPRVESHFWWEGRLTQDTEVMLVLKSTEAHRAQLVALIGQIHPYDLPAITWSVQGAPDAVVEWISVETSSRG